MCPLDPVSYSFHIRFVVFVLLMKRVYIADGLGIKQTMEGLKEDTAFRLQGLETKEQFIAQNTHKLPVKELPLLQNLANTINMQQETNTNSELGIFFCGKIAFEQMLESFQLRSPQQPRSGVRVAFV